MLCTPQSHPWLCMCLLSMPGMVRHQAQSTLRYTCKLFAECCPEPKWIHLRMPCTAQIQLLLCTCPPHTVHKHHHPVPPNQRCTCRHPGTCFPVVKRRCWGTTCTSPRTKPLAYQSTCLGRIECSLTPRQPLLSPSTCPVHIAGTFLLSWPPQKPSTCQPDKLGKQSGLLLQPGSSMFLLHKTYKPQIQVDFCTCLLRTPRNFRCWGQCSQHYIGNSQQKNPAGGRPATLRSEGTR